MSKVKANLTSTTKKIIIAIVVAAVVIGGLVGGIVYLSNNSEKEYSKLIISAMPETIVGNDNGKEITFYMEYNEDYNPDTDMPLNAYKPYYFNDKGEKVSLADGYYKSQTANMWVTAGFLYKARENTNTYKAPIYVVIALLALLIIALLIFLWYKSWVRRENLKAQRIKNDSKKKGYLNDFADEEK